MSARVAGRLVLAALVLALFVGGLLGIHWYWRRITLARVVEQGLAALAAANTPIAGSRALDEWERQTTTSWNGRREELIVYLMSDGRLADPRARALLTRVTGADYGDRQDEWTRWFETRRLLRQGRSPKVAAREHVELSSVWKAPIGLTAWFTSILPLDGAIYVPSLGAAFEDETDTADGIVRIDGKTGMPEIVFEPPDGPLRDMLGLAAGDDCLFATCRNGYVYCVAPDGRLRWKSRQSAPAVGLPLSLDVNGDGVTDVIVVSTKAVAALSGHNGNTLWTSPAGRAPARGRDTHSPGGVALAAGHVVSDTRLELIVTTPDGDVRVLASNTGKQVWQGALAAGSRAGPLVCAGMRGGGPPAYLVDRDARTWSLLRSGKSLKAVASWELLNRPSETVVSALRTLAGDGRPPALIACTTGSQTDYDACVFAIEPDGVRWQYAPGGAIWATPALADLNGDKQTELIVPSIETDAKGQATGAVTILSAGGQCLRRLTFPVPIECSPVVADVDGDERLEVLIADPGGWLYCYATHQCGPVEWGVLGGDSHNTCNADNAFRYGQVPFGLKWKWEPD